MASVVLAGRIASPDTQDGPSAGSAMSTSVSDTAPVSSCTLPTLVVPRHGDPNGFAAKCIGSVELARAVPSRFTPRCSTRGVMSCLDVAPAR